MVTLFQELDRFMRDRGLHRQPFDLETYLRMDYEETFEIIGRSKVQCKTISRQRAGYDVFQASKLEKPTDEELVAELADKAILAMDAIIKLGYFPQVVILEKLKVINSREGEIINGKFEKYLTPEAREKWYTPDYRKALRGSN